MKYFQLSNPQPFVGREREIKHLNEFSLRPEAAMLVVYGRRRVGKTELIEHVFHTKQLIKLEGLESGDQTAQIDHVLRQLAQYTEQAYLSKIQIKNWVECFELIYELVIKEPCVLYFEEVQWLANYQDEFASALKYVWDNRFRHHSHFKMILCGSSPSFMMNQIIQSKALYNRTLYELHLKEFSLVETKAFLNTSSNSDVVRAYLSVGGIPEYLKRLKGRDSIFLNLCKESFTQNGFFTTEFHRIFISSFASSVHYKAIIEVLSRNRFMTRDEMIAHLDIKSGGSLSEILHDLEQCGFIERYVPMKANEHSLLGRYAIVDHYLRFYYKFIQPISKQIKSGQYDREPAAALSMNLYQQWLGYAFEQYCRQYHWVVAKILGFSAVKYHSGAYFNRKTDKEHRGFQIDLIYERADRVYTICEIKYANSKVDCSVVDEFSEKLARFNNPKQWEIQRVLITTIGVTEALEREHYFDKVITIDDLFQ